MGRVKINLASGSVFEKPLVTFFKGTNGDYIVLDNETNGSMGLPIICIGRVEGTTVSKIVDPTEWTSVKENLKTIIAGTALPYLPVPETLSASDEFYTQLTLPIASFDLLKNTYNVPEASAPAPEEASVQPAEPMADVSPVGPVSPIDISPISVPPVEEVASIPAEETVAAPEPVTVPEEPIAEEVPPIESVPDISIDIAPVPEVPQVEEIPQATETPQEEVAADPIIAPVETVAQEEPVQESVTPFEIDNSIIGGTQTTDQDLSAIKETFMKSCENMFDALVEKFKN